MTTQITEGRQVLEFSDDWRVVKWDDCAEYKGRQETALHNLAGASVKAADVVAARETPASVICVAEFKDFANPAISPPDRAAAALQATSPKLMSDVVRKVIDSLCGAVHSHDGSNARSVELEAFRRTLARSQFQLLVILCVEVASDQIPALSIWTTELRRRLQWLGPRAQVIVTSSAAAFAGFGVTYHL